MKQLFLSVILFVSSLTYAQHSIQSSVFDSKNGQPIEMGTVRLLRPNDSTLVQGCQTDLKGGFELTKIRPGNYILIISSVGYNDYKRNITVERKDLILKSIQMQENVQALKEVEVKGTAAQMVVKGDTLEYNATAFKTAENAVVEDLLKRLPGVEISSEGKITVNGEEIKKIRVDGKKFFGDDVEMTTKNIPADMIEKIQVLEEKSDMARLTGFEDNETERIINLTTKPNRKKGLFGNATAGLGLDMDNNLRYDGNAFLNIVEGDAQTAITAGGNNINTSRSSRGRFGGGGINSGITTTENIGVNNNTIVNPNFKIGGDASFNHSVNDTRTISDRESYLKGSVYNNWTGNTSQNENYSANVRLEAEWKIDSLNTIIFQPNMNYNRSNSASYRDFIYRTDGDSTSWGNTQNTGFNTSVSGGLNVIYNRKFASKRGRTFTANLQTSFSQSDNESFNYSEKMTPTNKTIVDQFTNNTSDRYSANLRMSFVEPLWNNKNVLESSLSLRSSSSSSEKLQYTSDDPLAHLTMDKNIYTNVVDEYSNNFRNIFFSETLEFNYRYTEKDYNLTLGIKGEPSQTRNERIYGNGFSRDTTYGVFNVSPTGRFQYNFGRKKYARIDYRGQTDQPSINQMQPVKNNSNLMNETVGNPGLNPSFSHRLRLMYSTFNDKTFSSFNTMLSANATKDALVANSIYDETGKQYSQTVNAGATPYNLSGNVMFNTPIIQKRLHFNTSTSGSYSMRYGYSTKGMSTADIDIDNLKLGDLSETGRIGAEEQLSLTFTHDVVELGLRGGLRYSKTSNNLNNNPSETYDWTGRGNVVFRLPYNINITSDISYTTRQGYANFDQNELIWNATIDKNLFKNKGVLSLRWNDILRQQLNIRQTIGDNYIQYNSYNTLTSYFMLSFSYKINKFAGMNNPSGNSPANDQRFGPGMRGGGGGDRPPRNMMREGDI
jgi:hypothetical protein